jgi:hypothetical protein
MGVKGLWKCIRKSEDKLVAEEVFPGQTTLIVDALSFLFHLIDAQTQTVHKYLRPTFCKSNGGDYRELDKLITAEVQRLRDVFGFELIFMLDGPDSFFKAHTLRRRQERIDEAWDHLYHWVTAGTRTRIESLPMPPLCKSQLIDTLRSLGVPLVQCSLEADQEIAKECVRRNKTRAKDFRKHCFVYSADRWVSFSH